MEWMDFTRDGEVDAAESFFAAEMLCSSKEEHEVLFGDAGDFELDDKMDYEVGFGRILLHFSKKSFLQYFYLCDDIAV